MIKGPISLQDLRREIYRKAKADSKHRFWGVFVHVTKVETLRAAYTQAKSNGGAPGIDGRTFSNIENLGVDSFLLDIQQELRANVYIPQKNRQVEIPKDNGKVRTLQIPCIRDRVVQGALKIILESIFEADFCQNSYGYRPKRSPHQALAEVRRSVLRRMPKVVDIDLSDYFNTMKHSVLLEKIARRVQDPDVLRLIKLILKSGGKIGVPQGGPFSPLAGNIYLNDLDWYFDGVRRDTKSGPYEYVNYHRFVDDIVITVSGHYTKYKWPKRVMQRIEEKFADLGVQLNTEKSKVVNLEHGESFGFLGFDFRRVRNKENTGHYILMTPKSKSRVSVKARIRSIIHGSGSMPLPVVIARLNAVVRGWVLYFRVGNSSKAFSDVRHYLEMKVRTLLSRRKLRRKNGHGYYRWRREYLYDVLKLYWGWQRRPLPRAASVY